MAHLIPKYFKWLQLRYNIHGTIVKEHSKMWTACPWSPIFELYASQIKTFSHYMYLPIIVNFTILR